MSAANLLRRFAGVGLLALTAISAAACGRNENDVSGEWVAENLPVLRLYLYSDGRAVVSSIGMLDLRWSVVDPELVRIDALNSSVTANFVIGEDDRGDYGRLNLIGYDAAIFRKLDAH